MLLRKVIATIMQLALTGTIMCHSTMRAEKSKIK